MCIFISDQVVNELINQNHKFVYDVVIGRVLNRLEPAIIDKINRFFFQIPWEYLYSRN